MANGQFVILFLLTSCQIMGLYNLFVAKKAEEVGWSVESAGNAGNKHSSQISVGHHELFNKLI